jgi:hypothetical protein
MHTLTCSSSSSSSSSNVKEKDFHVLEWKNNVGKRPYTNDPTLVVSDFCLSA